MTEKKHKRNILASSFLIIKASLHSFVVNRNMETAATLAFYGFLSLMPLVLLALVALSHFLGSSETVYAALQNVLIDFIPSFNVSVLDDLTSISFKGVIGLVSILLLLLFMTPFAGALRSALAKMFKMPIAMPFFKSKLIDLATIVTFLLLFVLLAMSKVFFPDVEEGDDILSHLTHFTVKYLIPFLFSIGFIGLFFMVFSPVKLTWHQWLLGAVVVTLMWSLMRNLFIMFIQYNPNYGYAFGSLKAIFLLIVWVYYSFGALLLGAEIMANTFRREALLLHKLLEQGLGEGKNVSRLIKKFERKLKEGELLFSEGDPGHEMYVVLEGSVRLFRGDVELAVMPRDNFFGEMSLLRDTPRSVSAKAIEETRVAIITKENFDLLVRENPELVKSLLEELAYRLEETNEKLHALES